MNFIYGFALSVHMGLQGNFNEFIPHIRYEDESHIAGLYYNSERSISAYVGYVKHFDSYSVEYALVSGYDAQNILPYLRITKPFLENTQLFFSPSIEKHNTGTTTQTRLGGVAGIEFLF